MALTEGQRMMRQERAAFWSEKLKESQRQVKIAKMNLFAVLYGGRELKEDGTMTGTPKSRILRTQDVMKMMAPKPRIQKHFLKKNEVLHATVTEGGALYLCALCHDTAKHHVMVRFKEGGAPATLRKAPIRLCSKHFGKLFKVPGSRPKKQKKVRKPQKPAPGLNTIANWRLKTKNGPDLVFRGVKLACVERKVNDLKQYLTVYKTVQSSISRGIYYILSVTSLQEGMFGTRYRNVSHSVVQFADLQTGLSEKLSQRRKLLVERGGHEYDIASYDEACQRLWNELGITSTVDTYTHRG